MMYHSLSPNHVNTFKLLFICIIGDIACLPVLFNLSLVPFNDIFRFVLILLLFLFTLGIIIAVMILRKKKTKPQGNDIDHKLTQMQKIYEDHFGNVEVHFKVDHNKYLFGLKKSLSISSKIVPKSQGNSPYSQHVDLSHLKD